MKMGNLRDLSRLDPISNFSYICACNILGSDSKSVTFYASTSKYDVGLWMSRSETRLR